MILFNQYNVTIFFMTQVKKSMEDATFVAFCHFIADVFSGISKFSLLLQRNEIILPQVRKIMVCDMYTCIVFVVIFSYVNDFALLNRQFVALKNCC